MFAFFLPPVVTVAICTLQLRPEQFVVSHIKIIQSVSEVQLL